MKTCFCVLVVNIFTTLFKASQSILKGFDNLKFTKFKTNEGNIVLGSLLHRLHPWFKLKSSFLSDPVDSLLFSQKCD